MEKNSIQENAFQIVAWKRFLMDGKYEKTYGIEKGDVVDSLEFTQLVYEPTPIYQNTIEVFAYRTIIERWYEYLARLPVFVREKVAIGQIEKRIIGYRLVEKHVFTAKIYYVGRESDGEK